MRIYDLSYLSVNNALFSKPITMRVVEPDCLDEQTGAMLFSHGWGGNRLNYQPFMEYACETLNLTCASVEYRQSGYEFDPVKGTGAASPYDASFFQTFDVINGLRTLLEIHPTINRRRLFHFGGSQGGHIALLSAIFAPRTFAFVYATSALTHMDEIRRAWTDREFAPWELSIRNVIEHADKIRCPLLIDHGTADEILPDAHTRLLEEKLKTLGKDFHANYYPGGGHDLTPTTTRLDAFKSTAVESIKTLTLPGDDDFLAGTQVEIPCGQKTLVIDWSQPPASAELFKWK